jgi:alkylation response protein AidB-like acyl-CoA dehydrogenase
MTTTVQSTTGPTVQDARTLIPMIRDARPEIDRQLKLPEPMVDALRELGVWRMTQPRAWGGPETDIVAQFEVIEALSEGDGSVGWVAYIGSTAGYWNSFLDDEVGRSLYPDLDMITAGSVPPQGTAVPDGDGYRISGRWRFGSAVNHASYMISGAAIVDAQGQPIPGEHGIPKMVQCFVPSSAFEIVRNWDTLGLRGTGSDDYVVDDYYLPASQTFDFLGSPVLRTESLYRQRTLIQFCHAAVPLGIARAAIDEVSAILETKTGPDGSLVSANGSVTETLARAEATLGAARSYCLDVISDIWETLERGDELSMRQRALFRLALANVHPAAVQAIQSVMYLVGTSAIRVPGTLERSLRDAITAGQHQAGNLATYQGVGSMLLGGPPPHMF